MPIQNSTDLFGVAALIVDPTLGAGTHTTITAAVAAATANQTIFVRPGTYTENFTIGTALNLTAFTADDLEPNVTISGTITVTAAIIVSISNIRLQTNSAALLAITGTLASIVNLSNCYLNCLNNTGITYSSSSGSSALNIDKCKGNLATTGIGLITDTSAGTVTINHTFITNTGSSLTASTTSAAPINVNWSQLPIILSSTSTGAWNGTYSVFGFGASNTTALTIAGTSSGGFVNCEFYSGTASAVSIGTGSSCDLIECQISSTNTNIATGAGSLRFCALGAIGTSTTGTTNVTSNVANIFRPGITLSPLQPSFSAYASGGKTDVTGDGTAYTVLFDTKVYDRQTNYTTATGIFAAPFTGVYIFSTTVFCTGMTTAMTPISLALVTSTGTPTTATTTTIVPRTAVTTDNEVTLTGMFLMNAADTCKVVLTISGSTKTADVSGGADLRTVFSGWLLG